MAPPKEYAGISLKIIVIVTQTLYWRMVRLFVGRKTIEQITVNVPTLRFFGF